jgi:putative sigma-54 modulation protein
MVALPRNARKLLAPRTLARVFLQPFCLIVYQEGFMNLTISGHHVDVTPALRSYVESKLHRVARHFDQLISVNVLLSVEKQKEKERRQKAECNLQLKGKNIFAECQDQDLYAAIDELVDKLDRQVVEHKNRTRSHQAVPGKHLDLAS